MKVRQLLAQTEALVVPEVEVFQLLVVLVVLEALLLHVHRLEVLEVLVAVLVALVVLVVLVVLLFHVHLLEEEAVAVEVLQHYLKNLPKKSNRSPPGKQCLIYILELMMHIL